MRSVLLSLLLLLPSMALQAQAPGLSINALSPVASGEYRLCIIQAGFLTFDYVKGGDQLMKTQLSTDREPIPALIDSVRTSFRHGELFGPARNGWSNRYSPYFRDNPNPIQVKITRPGESADWTTLPVGDYACRTAPANGVLNTQVMFASKLFPSGHRLACQHSITMTRELVLWVYTIEPNREVSRDCLTSRQYKGEEEVNKVKWTDYSPQ